MAAISYQPWYQGATFPVWDIPLMTDPTVSGTSSTAVSPGSVQITCSAGFIATVTTATPIVVDAGTANQETVTPSAVNINTNQFTATFAHSHAGTYSLIANAEDLTASNINQTSFWLVFRPAAGGSDITGTGSFSVKSTLPAEMYYQPSAADVASVFSGYLFVKALTNDSPPRTVVYDPIGGVGNTLATPVPFQIVAS